MTNHEKSSVMHQRLENFKPGDVKSLVQQQGKAMEGTLEFSLKDISPDDPTLQAIISDPYFEVRPIGNQTKSGEMYYDLKTIDRQVRIRIICHKINSDEKK
jgi:hypothetical protein